MQLSEYSPEESIRSCYVQQLYPIEMSTRIDTTPDVDSTTTMETAPESLPLQLNEEVRRRLTRGAALEARDKIVGQTLSAKE